MRAFLLVALGCAWADCPPSGTQVVVDTSKRELSLCEAGKAAHKYRVSLGRGGVDKQREGDKRTPLGEYPLSPGRPSDDFHTFLPVGYPTPEQRKAGYTGGDIGVHGPKRKYRWLGRLATLSNWTQGCIAVASDAQIDEIDAWVRAHHARTISIR